MMAGVLAKKIIKMKTSSSSDESGGEEENDEDFFDPEKIKKKFMSAWNNVKYGFNLQYKPTFNDRSPIWFLGRCYHSLDNDGDVTDACVENREEKYRILSLDCFFEDFSSLIWLTYRKHFSQLADSDLTSDGGWGCMLRSGQMLLANAILIHMLKEGWRTSQRKSFERNYTYRMILRFFNDENSDFSPFSLHELVRIGSICIGKKPGEWYGPTSVSHTISAAVNSTSHPALETFRVYVANDCTIYTEDVYELATKCRNCTDTKCQDKFWRSILILVPVRLGSDGLNPIYVPCLQSLLTLDHCVGIIGGRPKHSLYFVGFQGSKLINLDPHYLQDSVDMTSRDFPVDSFHCQYPKKTGFRKMDPSCAVGFYCRTKEDFLQLRKQVVEVLTPPLQRAEYPIFVISDGRNPHQNISDELDGMVAKVKVGESASKNSVETVEISYVRTKKKGNKIKEKEVTEEYVLLE